MKVVRSNKQQDADASLFNKAPLYPKSKASWILTLCAVISCLIAVGYLCFTSLPVYTTAHRALISEWVVTPVATKAQGEVVDVLVQEGDKVAAGDKLFLVRMRQELGGPSSALQNRGVVENSSVKSNTTFAKDFQSDDANQSANPQALEASFWVVALKSGRIVDVRAREGDFVRKSKMLASIVDSQSRIYAVVHLSSKEMTNISIGSRVILLPNYKSSENGQRIHGIVKNISSLPISVVDINPIFTMKEAAFEVTIELPVQYQFSPKSAPFLPGEMVSSKFIIEEPKLIEWLFSRFE